MPEKTPDIHAFLGSAPIASRSGPAGIDRRPGQAVCGDIDMRIDLEGTWHYLGSPIGRKELVKLFSTVLRRDDAGDYWLITPSEMCRIRVDDAPFLAVAARADGVGVDQTVTLTTNIDQTVALGGDHPLRLAVNPETGEPRPYVALDHGLEARLTRSVFYQLVELAVAEKVRGEHIYGVWSGGQLFPLAPPAGPDADDCNRDPPASSDA